MKHLFASAVVIVGALGVAACGGGGGTPTLSDSEIEQIRSDERVVRAGRIVERSDTLLIPGTYLDISATAQGQTVADRIVARSDCRGTRCILRARGEQTTVTLSDLLTPSPKSQWTRADLGRRGGFDTILFEGRDRLSEAAAGDSLTVSATVTSYGFWGEHGVAVASAAGGPLSGSVQGVAVTGHLEMATAYTAGDTTGFNPGGFGSATWRGISEAVSTRSFERRAGTATIAILDLERPFVDVDINIAGFQIGSSSWNRIPVTQGKYSTGYHGRDRLVGNFHGPSHEETYGAFDTGAYVGAFGAKRQ